MVIKMDIILVFSGFDRNLMTLLLLYFQDLIEIEAICNGPDLREFLAYEGDSHIAFVKKSPDITVSRFDKVSFIIVELETNYSPPFSPPMFLFTPSQT